MVDTVPSSESQLVIRYSTCVALYPRPSVTSSMYRLRVMFLPIAIPVPRPINGSALMIRS